MPFSIQFNANSEFASRQQINQSRSINTRFERLSTGLRINGAKDDSAGLSISTRMESQIRSLKRRTNNAHDALSFSQTAESALAETQHHLQRMRELAVHAANLTLNQNDREALQLEVTELQEEISKNDTLQFNHLNIFGGNHAFFISEDLQNSVEIQIKGAASTDLGRLVKMTSSNSIDVSKSLNDGELSLEVDGVTTSIRGSNATDDSLSTSLAGNSSIAKAAAINAASEETGVIALVEETITASSKLNATSLTSTTYLKINGAVISGFDVIENDADSALKDAINAVAQETGVTASHDRSGQLTLTAKDGRNIELETVGATSLVGFTNQVIGGKISLQAEQNFFANFTGKSNLSLGLVAEKTLNLGASSFEKTSDGKFNHGGGGYDDTIVNDFFLGGGQIDFSGNYAGAQTTFLVYTDAAGTNLTFFDETALNLELIAFSGDGTYTTASGISLTLTNTNFLDDDGTGDGFVDAFRISATPGVITFGSGSALMADTPISVDTIDLTTVEGANEALYVIDFALKETGGGRSTLGATQNRLTSTIQNLEQATESLSGAQSRIQDADFAQETALLAQVEITQQASISLLAQANLMPVIALQLLDIS